VGRADDHLSAVLSALEGRGGLSADEAQALDILRGWDHDAARDSAGAAIWQVFWVRWVQAVGAARFPKGSADFVAGWLNGLAGRLVGTNEAGWFASDADHQQALVGAFREALAEVRASLGDDPRAWRWGAIHHTGYRHPLGSVGSLGELLDQPSREIGGTSSGLNNSGFPGGRIPVGDPSYARNWESVSGAGYRLFADLGDPHGSMWSVTAESQSGNPGSPNHADQLDDFIAGRYHEIPLQRSRAEEMARHRLTVQPLVRR
jgi:penicillin amidase